MIEWNIPGRDKGRGTPKKASPAILSKLVPFYSTEEKDYILTEAQCVKLTTGNQFRPFTGVKVILQYFMLQKFGDKICVDKSTQIKISDLTSFITSGEDYSGFSPEVVRSIQMAKASKSQYPSGILRVYSSDISPINFGLMSSEVRWKPMAVLDTVKLFLLSEDGSFANAPLERDVSPTSRLTVPEFWVESQSGTVERYSVTEGRTIKLSKVTSDNQAVSPFVGVYQGFQKQYADVDWEDYMESFLNYQYDKYKSTAVYMTVDAVKIENTDPSVIILADPTVMDSLKIKGSAVERLEYMNDVSQELLRAEYGEPQEEYVEVEELLSE